MQTATLHPAAQALALPARLAREALGLPTILGRWVRRRRAIARTVSELSAMTDRGLADLGILRSDIARLARETAGDAT